jgi:hypothetical protein
MKGYLTSVQCLYPLSQFDVKGSRDACEGEMDRFPVSQVPRRRLHIVPTPLKNPIRVPQLAT